ncbi:hypothetical protein ACFL2K_00745 [Candidatus Margulisiibacteriota bacterium]
MSKNKIISLIQNNQPVTLKYKNMEIMVRPKGAQVLKFMVDGKNVLFYDAKDLKHSGIPVCFPIFGPLSKPLEVNGKSYKMNQHGFFRDLSSKLEKVTKNSVTYSLSSNSKTLAMYPYHFKLSITYIMKNNSLEIKANIKHLDKEKNIGPMPFVLAFHPYFAVKNQDNIQFKTSGTKFYDNLLPENKKSFTKISDIANSKYFEKLDNNFMKINKNPDAHITNHKEKGTILRPGTNAYQLALSWDNFPYLTTWRKHENAKYICVEPATSQKNALIEAKTLNIPKGKSRDFVFKVKVVS